MTLAATFGTAASGTTKVLPVAVVETNGEITRQLQVLALVVADGDSVGVVDEDVRRHQDRDRS